MRRLLLASAVAAFAVGCSPSEDQAKKNAEASTETAAVATSAPAPAPAPIAPAATEAPSGDYKIDKAHTSLVFRVNHIGFSNYTAQFGGVDGTLKLDAKDPSKSSLEATVDTGSLTLVAPPAGFLDTLLNEKWLGAKAFPKIVFRSTKIELTGAKTARVTGDLTLRGATQPITLDATFNGGYAGHPYDPNARIGFSLRGSLKRSSFGVSEGIPPPGSTMGVSDDVTIEIETELNGPPQANPPTPPSQGVTP
jgi:polyisoprenoid-binding protein YceI